MPLSNAYGGGTKRSAYWLAPYGLFVRSVSFWLDRLYGYSVIGNATNYNARSSRLFERSSERSCHVLKKANTTTWP